MRTYWMGLLALLYLTGCGSWGDFTYKSDRFKYKVTFPEKWEVWDRSDDSADFLVGSLPESPKAVILVKTHTVAPDLSPQEIYPSFMDGSEYAGKLEFKIEDKGAISCKNAEGRFVKFGYLGEEQKMRGIRALFLGERYIMEITMEMPEDDFLVHEMDFNMMIHLIEL